MSGKYQLNVEQGATLIQEFLLKQKDSLGVVTPVNLTGFKAYLHIRKFYEDEVLLEASIENGLIQIVGVDGKIVLTVPATTTALIPSGRWVWELKTVAPDNITVDRVLSGNVIVSPQVVEL